jgi:hypothetical protein
MADWVTISSLATAAGTMVLAIATFSSVRAGSRSARIAERALQIGVRPVLFPSRREDPDQEIMWGDRHWAAIPGGGAVIEISDGTIYLALSLRNVGSGIAVLRGWRAGPPDSALNPTTAVEQLLTLANVGAPDAETFRAQGRDLYVPADDTSFWQAAIRDRSDPDYDEIVRTIVDDRALYIDLLYGDHEGGQRAISRFSVIGGRAVTSTDWQSSVVRHWNLDREDPR